LFDVKINYWQINLIKFSIPMTAFFKHFSLLVLFGSLSGFSQTILNDDCNNAIPLCFNEWVDGNNYNATIDSCISCSDWVDSDLCFELNNSVWFSFTTNSLGGPGYVFIKSIQCDNSSDDSYSNEIQATVLKANTSCNSSTYEFVSRCEVGKTNDFSLGTIHLEAFQTYFILIDGGTTKNGQLGLNAAECGFKIRVNGGAINPEFSAGDDIYLEYGNSVVLSGTGNGFATWFPSNNLSNSNILNPVFSGLNNAELELTIEELNGCKYIDRVSIFVEKTLGIPNAITTDEDGINEFWIIENIDGYPTSSLSIYDRWGQQVYNAVGYDNSSPWGGKRNNNYLPAGTYFYIIDTKSSVTQKIYTGSISIIK
jgi:gliding motility-associated-like protein